ncbi:MAG: HlyD family secretion protein [Tropicimonas sp.]|uniref:HlyD family secretion protein n=1 Tax=Tropicimonas sp. TaxID=2067044 RepID=UPI003A8725A5
MSQDLYRKEAFESKIRGFSNPISIRGSVSAAVVTALIFAVLAVLVVYGWNSPYSRKVTVTGELAPQSGNIAVRTSLPGIVSIMVRDGDLVKKGQVLARIDEELAGTPGRTDSEIELTSLRERRDLIDQRLESADRRIAQTKRVTALRIENAEISSAALEQQIEMAESEQDLALNALERRRGLVDKSLSTQSELEMANTNVLNAQRSLIEAKSKHVVAVAERSSAELEGETELSRIREEMISLRAERLSILKQIDQIGNESTRELRAPIAGHVVFTRARDQERVAQGETVFTIVPDDEALVALLYAPSSAIGFVKLGDPVYLRYDAYPYREHGIFTGTVDRIDSAPQMPQDIGAVLSASEPVYRIYARIDQTPENKRRERLRLIAGMRFEASIVADQKPILFWLLDPVL